MDGILIIDKAPGMTSFDAVRRVRRLCGIRRVGHAGTLDPLATGVLPVAVGEATRIVEFLMEGAKTYRATLKLGEITDTQDSEGEVLERRPVCGLTDENLRAAFASMTGIIQQVPPMYSALKRNGIPLHKLARQGVEVERKARSIEIKRLEILEVDLPEVTFEVDCSKGTYVRSLCHDLGLALGTGAHLIRLRRTRNGNFSEAQSVSLDRLEEMSRAGDRPELLPLTAALKDFAALEVSPKAALRLRDGVPPELASVTGPIPEREGERVLLLEGETLLGIAVFAPSRSKEKRGDFELLRVFNRPRGR